MDKEMYRPLGGLLIREGVQPLLPQVDTLLFDVDGVLIDVSGSIRMVNFQAVERFFADRLGWREVSGIFTQVELELFKRAGGFNSDWDLTHAVVLFYLFKHIRYDKSGMILKEYPPSVEEFTRAVAARGGWLRSAESVIFGMASPDETARIYSLWDRAAIQRTFQELFVGDLCEEVYGFRPEWYAGPGMIRCDRAIIDLKRLPQGMKLGILTGRTAGEAKVGLKLVGANGQFVPGSILTEDDGIKKPHPTALKTLCDRLGTSSGIYIGDTPDDLTTVEMHRQQKSAPMLSGMVLSGPGGEAYRHHFMERGADIIAADVNLILDLFRAQGEAGSERNSEWKRAQRN